MTVEAAEVAAAQAVEGQSAAVEAGTPEAKQPSMAEQLAAKQAALKAEAGEPGAQDKSPTDVPGEGDSDKPDAKPSLDSENLAQTGDAVLDAGIKMMQQVAGLNAQDVDRMLAHAYERNDASLVDSAYIKERFGEHAGYVEQLAKAYIERTGERVQSVVKQVHEAAGGKENWDNFNATFQQHAPAHLKKAAEALADSEDFVGASQLIMEFAKSSGLVPVPGTHIAGGGAVANGALSGTGFREELAKLRAEVGNRSFESGPAKAKYDTLVRRRQAGRMQGLK